MKVKCIITILGPLLLITALSMRPSIIEKHEQCGPSRADLKRPFKMLVTVYDSTDNKLEGGSITCTGKKLRHGMIAADLSYFPLGTKLFFDNMWHTVEDVGDAIKGKRIDKFVPGSHGNLKLWRKEWVLVRMEIKEPAREKIDARTRDPI